MLELNDGIRCYVCESSKVRTHVIRNNTIINRCCECGLLWAKGINKGLINSFYNKDYFNSNSNMGYKDYLADEESHRKNSQHILFIADKVNDLSGMKILDVGCAFGFFLDEARKLKHCQAYGVEISKYACDYAVSRLKLNVTNTVLGSAGFEPDFFDAAFMIGTIEHLESPCEEIDAVSKVLKPGGLLVITTIDTRGLFPIYSIKPPEHLFYFNKLNLSILLKRFGFEVLIARPYLASYRLDDIFYRLGQFFSLSFISKVSNILKRALPNMRIKIPTNEIVMVAKKASKI